MAIKKRQQAIESESEEEEYGYDYDDQEEQVMYCLVNSEIAETYCD
jgi:hypothetical protein